MQYKTRSGEMLGTVTSEDRMFQYLYTSAFGNRILRAITKPEFSKAAGFLLSTPLSVLFIDPFIRINRVDLTDCIPKRYHSYNDFFTRRIRTERRPIDRNPKHLISPCDGKLTVIPITEEQKFDIKHTTYTLSSLLHSRSLAADYTGGTALLFRLSVNDYHRYCYIDDADREINHIIPGLFHTVNPNAAENKSIYTENTRSWCLMNTKNFSQVLHMEIGALLVGKIHNSHGRRPVLRGQEKGWFEFGGSSILLLFRKDTILPDADLLRNTAEGFETAVRMGECIGTAAE